MRQRSMSSASEIGARIRELRIAQRMSQAELAEKSNISLPHISEIELGKSDMKLQNFIRIIEALQVSADSILRANVPSVAQLLGQEYADLLSDCTPEEIQSMIKLLLIPLKRRLLHYVIRISFRSSQKDGFPTGATC